MRGMNRYQGVLSGLTMIAVLLTGAVMLQAGNLTWTGSASTTWNTADANWAGDAAVYTDGDDVTFTDSGAGVITISGTRAPGSVTFNNTTGNDYTFNTGNLSQGGALTATGTATAIFSVNDALPDIGRISIASGARVQYKQTEHIGSLSGDGTFWGVDGNHTMLTGSDNTDSTFSGTFAIGGGGSGTIGKVGKGTFTFSGYFQTTTGLDPTNYKSFKVYDGTMVDQAARLNYVVYREAALVLDQAANASALGLRNETFSGGDVICIGNDSVNSSFSFSGGTLATAGDPTITILNGSGQTAILKKTHNNTGLEIGDGGALLIRGNNLTGDTKFVIEAELFGTTDFTLREHLVGGTTSNILGRDLPQYINYNTAKAPVVRHVFADTSATGNGIGFATYETDGQTENAGTYHTRDPGFRPLNSSEYSSTLTSGEAFGDPTQMENKRFAAAVTGIDASTRVTTLTLQTGGSVAGTGTLVVESGGIMSTGTNGAVTVANLEPGHTVLKPNGEQFTLITPDKDDFMTISSDMGNTDLGVAKSGLGTVELTGTNTYTGSTRINGGALRALDNGSVIPGHLNLLGGVLESNGTFNRSLGTGATNVSWADQSSGGFAANGGQLNVQLNGGTGTITWGSTNFVDLHRDLKLGSYTADDTVNFQNGLNLGAFNYLGSGIRTIEVEDNPNSTTDKAVIAGAITGTDARVMLRKTGAGILQLDAVNDYAGATDIVAGTLLVGDAGQIGGSGVTVRSGAVLGGGGVVLPHVTVETGGTLGAGASIGDLELAGGVSFAADSFFDVEISGTVTPGTDYDQLVVSGGDVELNGILNISDSLASAVFGDVLYIVDNKGSGTTTGTFQYGDDAIVGVLGGRNWKITYNAIAELGLAGLDGGNDVALYAIPEPASLILLAGGLLAMLRRRS